MLRATPGLTLGTTSHVTGSQLRLMGACVPVPALQHSHTGSPLRR